MVASYTKYRHTSTSLCGTLDYTIKYIFVCQRIFQDFANYFRSIHSYSGLRVFFLVISYNSNAVTSTKRLGTLSFRNAAFNVRISLSLLSGCFILIKSTRIIPDKFRNRNCFAISTAASSFTFNKCSSCRFFPMDLPVFTSIKIQKLI